MSELFFTNILSSSITLESFMYCTLAALLLGAGIAATSKFRNHVSGGFVLTLAIIPFIVEVLMMLVNGNIGVGVAVAGAFSLVRFRSVQGSAKEILLVFLAMAVGLSCGTGYIGVAILLAVISCILITVGSFLLESSSLERVLRITIPEDLNYTEVFDDELKAFTKKNELLSVKSTNMGSLYKLTYRIVLKDAKKEKEMIDALRCKNGNLEILCAREITERKEM